MTRILTRTLTRTTTLNQLPNCAGRCVMLAVALISVTACEDLNNLFGPSETPASPLAPAEIFGRTVRFSPTWSDCGMIGTHWGAATLHFESATVIRGINVAGGSFNLPSDSWWYRRTGDRSAELYIDWSNGTENTFELEFISATSGTYSVVLTGGGPPVGSDCGAPPYNLRGDFRLEE